MLKTGPNLSLWRPWAGSLLEASTQPQKTEWWGAGVVVCLEQGAVNSMIYI